jgi:large subunit ribosomal protein L9
MDVILLKDVEPLGKEGMVVHVKPGYARNYLLPQHLALPATSDNLKAVEDRKHRAQQKLLRLRKQAETLKQKLESRSLTLQLTLSERDTPFGSITTHDLVEALSQEGISIDKQTIGLEEPIKALGIYEIPIRLHPEVTATLKLWVVKA